MLCIVLININMISYIIVGYYILYYKIVIIHTE